MYKFTFRDMKIYSVFWKDLDHCLTFDLVHSDVGSCMSGGHDYCLWQVTSKSLHTCISFYVWLSYENDINFHCDLDLRPWQPTVGLCISSGHAHHSYQFILKSLRLCSSYIPDIKVTMFFVMNLTFDLHTRVMGCAYQLVIVIISAK